MFASRGVILGNGEMAEKLPVIIDNRGENKVLHALQRLLPNLQQMDIATIWGTRVFANGQLHIHNSRNNRTRDSW